METLAMIFFIGVVIWIVCGVIAIAWVSSDDEPSDSNASGFEQLMMYGTLLVLGPVGLPIVWFCVWATNDDRKTRDRRRAQELQHIRRRSVKARHEREEQYIRARKWRTDDPDERALLDAEHERVVGHQELEREIIGRLQSERPHRPARSTDASESSEEAETQTPPPQRRTRKTWREERPLAWRD